MDNIVVKGDKLYLPVSVSRQWWLQDLFRCPFRDDDFGVSEREEECSIHNDVGRLRGEMDRQI